MKGFPKNEKASADKQIYTVLQPDIFVVCDLVKPDDSPDLIVEIVSPKNFKRDLKDKFEIYQEHGVREYWIVNPNDENVSVFVLGEKGKYQLVGMYAEDDKIPVNIFNGDLKVDLTEVFTSLPAFLPKQKVVNSDKKQMPLPEKRNGIF